MAKHKRKVQQSLMARIKSWQENGAGRHPGNGMGTHKPGSQNRKKSGYGGRSSNR